MRFIGNRFTHATATTRTKSWRGLSLRPIKRWIIWGNFRCECLTMAFFVFDIDLFFFFLIRNWIAVISIAATQKRVFSPKWMRKSFYYFLLFLSCSPPLPPFLTRIHILPSPKIRSGFLFPVWLSRSLARQGDAFSIYFCIAFRFTIVHLPHGTTQNLYCAPNVHSCSVRVCVCMCVRCAAHIEQFHRKIFFFMLYFSFLFFVHIWRSTTIKKNWRSRLVSLCGDFSQILGFAALHTEPEKNETGNPHNSRT